MLNFRIIVIFKTIQCQFCSSIKIMLLRGGSRIFFRRGCTRLLLYFNTNKPHNFFFFFWQNTSCIRKPQVISGGGGMHTPCTLPLDLPLLLQHIDLWDNIISLSLARTSLFSHMTSDHGFNVGLPDNLGKQLKHTRQNMFVLTPR